MTTPGVSCGSPATTLSGFEGAEFSALDVLALKLICLDTGFAAPVRQIGSVFGQRIALEQSTRPLSADEALSRMLSACGLPSVLESRFLKREAHEVRLQITGCADACCPVPNIGRAVCGFNAGVFEGFLRGVTSEPWAVEETKCLGLGHASCEFVIRVEHVSDTSKEGLDGRY